MICRRVLFSIFETDESECLVRCLRSSRLARLAVIEFLEMISSDIER